MNSGSLEQHLPIIKILAEFKTLKGNMGILFLPLLFSINDMSQELSKRGMQAGATWPLLAA